ncbi:MAG: hypothetical protein PVI75_08930 [Gammaproteobacteria bacterium]|jgi:hypothetical protein
MPSRSVTKNWQKYVKTQIFKRKLQKSYKKKKNREKSLLPHEIT